MVRIVAYAIVDESVEWTGRQLIFVGDEKLGPVPRLALGCDVGGALKDVLILYCNEDWEVLALTGAETIEAAKVKTEAAYRGLHSKWVATDVTVEEAQRYITENYQHMFCLFCGRRPTEVKSLVTQKLGAICDRCIQEFHAWLEQAGKPENGG
jgi:hypothetical protein